RTPPPVSSFLIFFRRITQPPPPSTLFPYTTLFRSSAHWPANQYSVPAGFVEPGESLESAVRREVLEETRVRVDQVRYGASQPWPFPASLMCAFTGRTTDRHPVPDGEEVVDARFVDREQIARSWAEGSIRPPRPTSVARALIEDWFGRPLPR